MDAFKRRKRTGEIYYSIVLTVAEAESFGIDSVPWRQMPGVGSWVTTDDGYVTKVTHRGFYKGKSGQRDYMRTFIGPIFSDADKFDYLPRKETRDFNSTKPLGWVEREMRTQRLKRAVRVYVRQLFETGNKKINWDAVGLAYRPDQKAPALTVKRLFKQQEVMSLIDDEVRLLLKKEGITKEYVINLHKQAVEISKSKGDVGNLLKAADMLAEYLEMKPEKKTMTQTLQLEQYNSRMIEDAIVEDDRKRLTLKEEIENPDE